VDPRSMLDYLDNREISCFYLQSFLPSFSLYKSRYSHCTDILGVVHVYLLLFLLLALKPTVDFSLLSEDVRLGR